MTPDPLLGNDLTALLRSFPNDALHDLVAVLKQHKSLSPFSNHRAYAAHALPVDGDFTAHSTAIAEEVLWWGSHDVHRQFANAPGWIDVLKGTAKHLEVPEKERVRRQHLWDQIGDLNNGGFLAHRNPKDVRRQII